MIKKPKEKEASTGTEAKSGILRGEKVELNHKAVVARGVLYEKEESRKQFGVNGNILAVIELPMPDTEQPRQLAVVDYGPEDTDEKRYIMWDPDGGRPMKGLGVASRRYALFGINYTPRDAYAAYNQIPGSGLTIGREPDQSGTAHRLGLDSPDSDQISRIHAVVNVDPEDGLVYIEDRSTNGTDVTVAQKIQMLMPPEQSEIPR